MDSHLKTLLRDHATSAIQATKRVKKDSKYEEVNLVATEAICGQNNYSVSKPKVRHFML